MKKLLIEISSHKDLYFISSILGVSIGSVITFISKIHEMQLLGVSLSLFMVTLVVNIIDIHTGIKADTVLKKKDGKDFKFESGRAWRAMEKIAVFTVIIWFLWSLEKESLRLNFYVDYVVPSLIGVKFSSIIYIILIELQSIGENDEVRFGKKSKIFVLLDTIIKIVNEGIANKIKSLVKK